MRISRFIVMLLSAALSVPAYAYFPLFKSDNGPTEEGMKAFLQKEFDVSEIEFNSYKRTWDSYNPSGILDKTRIRDLTFTVSKDGAEVQFTCRVSVQSESLMASITDCKPSNDTSLMQLNKIPRWREDKKLSYDFLNDKLKPENRDQIYAAFKARMDFDNYSCNEGAPAFNYSGYGEVFSLLAAKDKRGFVLYSTPTAQNTSRVAAGDGIGLTMYEKDGSVREVSFGAISMVVDSTHGVKNLALGAGVYFREDLQRASQFISECCNDKSKCPKTSPQPVSKTLVLDPGVQR